MINHLLEIQSGLLRNYPSYYVFLANFALLHDKATIADAIVRQLKAIDDTGLWNQQCVDVLQAQTYLQAKPKSLYTGIDPHILIRNYISENKLLSLYAYLSYLQKSDAAQFQRSLNSLDLNSAPWPIQYFKIITEKNPVLWTTTFVDIAIKDRFLFILLWMNCLTRDEDFLSAFCHNVMQRIEPTELFIHDTLQLCPHDFEKMIFYAEPQQQTVAFRFNHPTVMVSYIFNQFCTQKNTVLLDHFAQCLAVMLAPTEHFDSSYRSTHISSFLQKRQDLALMVKRASILALIMQNTTVFSPEQQTLLYRYLHSNNAFLQQDFLENNHDNIHVSALRGMLSHHFQTLQLPITASKFTAYPILYFKSKLPVAMLEQRLRGIVDKQPCIILNDRNYYFFGCPFDKLNLTHNQWLFSEIKQSEIISILENLQFKSTIQVLGADHPTAEILAKQLEENELHVRASAVERIPQELAEEIRTFLRDTEVPNFFQAFPRLRFFGSGEVDTVALQNKITEIDACLSALTTYQQPNLLNYLKSSRGQLQAFRFFLFSLPLISGLALIPSSMKFESDVKQFDNSVCGLISTWDAANQKGNVSCSDTFSSNPSCVSECQRLMIEYDHSMLPMVVLLTGGSVFFIMALLGFAISTKVALTETSTLSNLEYVDKSLFKRIKTLLDSHAMLNVQSRQNPTAAISLVEADLRLLRSQLSLQFTSAKESKPTTPAMDETKAEDESTGLLRAGAMRLGYGSV